MKQFELNELTEHKNFYIDKLQPIKNALLKLYDDIEIGFNIDNNVAKIRISHKNLIAETLITGELINHAIPGKQEEIFRQLARMLAIKLIIAIDFNAAQIIE